MNVIFIHPSPVGTRISGSGLRPLKMLNLLKAKYNVFEITGTKTEREKKFKELKVDIKKGTKYEYAYFENLSTPHTMQTFQIFKRRLPKLSLLETRILLFLSLNNIKCGYFYRDIYWNFPQSLGSSRRKTLALRFFGYIELLIIKHLKIFLFVPHKNFAHYLLKNYRIKSTPLAPGSDLHLPSKANEPLKLKLFYVGGCGPLYNPSVFIQGVKDLENENMVSFDYSTRAKEWIKFNSQVIIPNNMTIHHCSGEKLIKFYRDADICVYPSPPSDYLRLTIPYKISEYICSGTPIIAYEGTNVSDIIRKFDIGWVCHFSSVETSKLIKHIYNNPAEIKQKQLNLNKIKHLFTWNNTLENLENTLHITNQSAID